MKHRFKYFWASVILFSGTAHANTFVGNGGNAGDVELIVTRQQLSGALERIINVKTDSLCVCSESFKNHSECESLKTLNDEQKNYCSSTLKSMAAPAYEFLSRDRVQFVWTHEKISVVDGDRVAAADAVADPDRRSITVNQSRFLSLSPSERVFLLAHEVFHLVKFEGRNLNDRDPIGPFTEAQGQKRLLNSMAAGVVVQADGAEQFSKYAPILRRPQGYKENWIEVGYSWGQFSSEPESIYGLKKFGGVALEYRHYFGNWGLLLGGHFSKQDERVLTSIETQEEMRVIDLGISYRIFPFKDPLSRLGQSYFAPFVALEYLQSEYTVSDPFNEVKSTKSSLTATGGFKYLISIGDIWAQLGASLAPHDYEHRDLGIKIESLKITTTLGVSYGF